MNSTGRTIAVGQRLTVAVAVVGLRAKPAAAVRLVADERDRIGVGAERGAGQHQPPGRRSERLAYGLAPAEGVAGVVDLVQDHQGLEGLGPDPEGQRIGRDAGVGERDAGEVRLVFPCFTPKLGSMARLILAAASAHWVFRCSVGATMITRSICRRENRLAARVSANDVLPAPGVATARKSRGSASK